MPVQLVLTLPGTTAAELLSGYSAGAIIRLQRDTVSTFASASNVTTVALVSGTESYAYWDSTGTASSWYRTRYENAGGSLLSSWSDGFQPGTSGVYASLGAFNRFVRDDNDDADGLKMLALEAASRAIDQSTDRSFVLAGSGTEARYFTAHRRTDGRYAVHIDDTFQTSPTVALDTAKDGLYSTASTAFRMYPLSAAAKDLPFTEILFNFGTTAPLEEGGVKVTTIWGWTALPPTIENATLLQASRLLKRRDSPFGIAGSPEMGSELRLLAQVDPDVAVMVRPYRKWSIG